MNKTSPVTGNPYWANSDGTYTVRASRLGEIKFPLESDDPNNSPEIDEFQQKIVGGDFDHLDSIDLGHKLTEALLKKKDREYPGWKNSMFVVGPSLWLERKDER